MQAFAETINNQNTFPDVPTDMSSEASWQIDESDAVGDSSQEHCSVSMDVDTPDFDSQPLGSPATSPRILRKSFLACTLQAFEDCQQLPSDRASQSELLAKLRELMQQHAHQVLCKCMLAYAFQQSNFWYVLDRAPHNSCWSCSQLGLC